MHHVLQDNQQFGPYSIQEINQYLAQGALNATAQVWDANANGWVEIWQVPGVVLPQAQTPTFKRPEPVQHKNSNAHKKKSSLAIGKFCLWACVIIAFGGGIIMSVIELIVGDFGLSLNELRLVLAIRLVICGPLLFVGFFLTSCSD